MVVFFIMYRILIVHCFYNFSVKRIHVYPFRYTAEINDGYTCSYI